MTGRSLRLRTAPAEPSERLAWTGDPCSPIAVELADSRACERVLFATRSLVEGQRLLWVGRRQLAKLGEFPQALAREAIVLIAGVVQQAQCVRGMLRDPITDKVVLGQLPTAHQIPGFARQRGLACPYFFG